MKRTKALSSLFEFLNRGAEVGRCRSGTGVSPLRFDSHRRDACATTWFMESFDLQNWTRLGAVNPIPLTRRDATLSPTGGEGRGEGARFMVRVGPQL